MAKTDYIPHCHPPGPNFQRIIDESVKAREELIKSNEYIIRLTRTYLEGMSCMVPNEHHQTYSEKAQLLCVTLPASLVFALVEHMEKGEEVEDKEQTQEL